MQTMYTPANLVSALSDLLCNSQPAESFIIFDRNCSIFNREESNSHNPDLFLASRPVQYASGFEHLITNPSIVVEVLSWSLTNNSPRDTLGACRTIKGFDTYVLVNADMPLVSVYEQIAADNWTIRDYVHRDEVAILERKGIQLPLSVIYSTGSPEPTDNIVKEPAVKYLPKLYSAEEYLLREQVSEDKHEFFRGRVVAMAGAKDNHNLIFTNVYGPMAWEARNQPCVPFGSDTRVHVTDSGLYTYPDISVYCYDDLEASPKDENSKVHPTAIVEILSPSSRQYDLTIKFQLYRQLASLQEYITIDSQQLSVVVSRKSGNEWRSEWLTSTEAILSINSLSTQIDLKQVYKNTSVTGRGLKLVDKFIPKA